MDNSNNNFNLHHSSDEQLMAMMAKGNKLAFELLYDRYFDKLVWFAQGFVQELHTAQDIVQDVFVKIIENPRSFDGDRKFSTWVYTITSNACRNILRNHLKRSQIINEQTPPKNNEAQRTADFVHFKKKIDEIYQGLSSKEKHIFKLRFEQEFSIKEITEISGMPEGSVKSGIFYLIKKLAKHLKEYSHE